MVPWTEKEKHGSSKVKLSQAESSRVSSRQLESTHLDRRGAADRDGARGRAFEQRVLAKVLARLEGVEHLWDGVRWGEMG